tara:strand:+ start:3816 stop:4040 length:225 start_codon:yes stop_codon:yes gene_type:complete
MIKQLSELTINLNDPEIDKTLRPRYNRLTSEFYKIIVIPILINISFNKNEPVVNSRKHAMDCCLINNFIHYYTL